MGTNYYLHYNVCECCGRSDEPLHIGKSSAGWCFSLHVGKMWPDGSDVPIVVHELRDWIELWSDPKAAIKDEYGDYVLPDVMLRRITDRHGGGFSGGPGPTYFSWDDFHRINVSEEGPNGLLRHKIDGRLCVGHGEGTYDLLVGEFG